MSRFISGTRLASNAVLLGLVTTVFLFIAGCAKSPEQLLDEARQQMDANDYPAASIALKNLLRENPDNLQGRLLLAEVSLALNDPLAAEKELTRARDLGAPATEHMSLHLDILFRIQRYTQMLEVLSSEPEELGLTASEALNFRGRALLGLGNSLGAEESFKEALSIQDGDPVALWGVAASKAYRGEKAEAMLVLDELISRSPDFAEGWLLRGQIAVRDSRLADAEHAFGMGIESLSGRTDRSTEALLLMGLAETQLGQKKLESAELTINQLRRINPRSRSTPFLVAKLAAARGDYAKAANDLESILDVLPNNLPAMLLYGTVNLAQGNFAQAEAVLTQVVVRNPDNIAARRLLAAAQSRLANPAGVIETLAPIIERGAASPEISVLASEALLQTGSREKAVALLEEALDQDPDNTNLILNLASAYLSVDRVEDAIRLSESLPSDDADYRKELILALAYAASDDSEAAAEQIAAIMRNHSEDVGALTLVGDFYLQRDDAGKGQLYFEKALAIDPQHRPALLGLARLYANQGDISAATERYEALLSIDPTDISSLMALANISAAASNLERSVALLEQAVEINDTSPLPRTMLARALIGQGDFIRAEELALEALELVPDDAVTHAVVGEIFLDVGKQDQALGYLTQAVDLDPGISRVWLSLAKTQIALGEYADSRESLNRSISLSPDALNPKLVLALVEFRVGNAEKALEIIDQLAQRYPEVSGPISLRGDILVSEGNFAAAADAYSRAFELAPSLSLARKAHDAAVRAGIENPESTLRSWVEINPEDADALALVAVHETQEGRTTEAEAKYERVLELDPENVVALNNLAIHYMETNPERAKELAMRAHSANPANPAVADTLGWVLVQQGELTSGLGYLEDAAGKAPGDAGIQYHLAYARKQLGDMETSAAILERILASAVEFSERDDAARLLDEIRSDD